jgi:hypothetical protein
LRSITLREVSSWLLVCLSLIGVLTFSTSGRGQSDNSHSAINGIAVDGVQIVVSTKRQIVAHGQPIRLEVLLRNLRKSDLIIRESEAASDFYLNLRDIKGKAVPFTRRWEKIQDFVGMGPAFILRISAGGERKYDIRADDQYNMTQPGVYFASVTRTVATSKGEKGIRVTSNTIKITVK